MKTKAALPYSTKPHWRAQISSKTISWQMIAALFPVWCIGLMQNAPAAFWQVLSSVAAGLFFRFLFSLVSKQKNWFGENTVYSCVLFSFLVPFGISPAALLVGIFFSVIIAEECFGGRGQNIFNPALTGFAAVSFLFRDELGFCYGEFGSILISTDPSQSIPAVEVALVLLGGVYLILKRAIAWQIPLFYFAPLFVIMTFIQDATAAKLPLAPVLFSTFFLVTDYASSPISVRARILYALVCGLLFAAFNEWLAGFNAMACSILLMNSVAPLMDRYLSSPAFSFLRREVIAKELES